MYTCIRPVFYLLLFRYHGWGRFCSSRKKFNGLFQISRESSLNISHDESFRSNIDYFHIMIYCFKHVSRANDSVRVFSWIIDGASQPYAWNFSSILLKSLEILCISETDVSSQSRVRWPRCSSPIEWNERTNERMVGLKKEKEIGSPAVCCSIAAVWEGSWQGE